MKRQSVNFNNILTEKGWSLFLDRDGVINRHIERGYVLNPGQLEIIEGVSSALPLLSRYFNYIFIVTNQQCVGRGLITMSEVDAIHDMMRSLIDPKRQYITDIFVSPCIEEERNEYRKPGTGMAKKAAALYRGVNLSRSVMAGDSATDMIFGRNAGMLNVLIGRESVEDISLYDWSFNSLYDFAVEIETQAMELI
ncbi:MAG TPA: HAD-IIIA family hydrolase [Bacteroidales bacterium]|nr:HAD-IIIA family hydrolase [Bacteroidales bacterium]